jgi:glycosyltransferase involved in cell wall biosynthesis
VKDAVLMENASQFSQEEMAVFMAAADVLAYPTRGEGFGIPSLEAMACKTPVVATNFGPQRELHDNGRGYLVKVVDSIPGEPGCLTFFAEPDWRDMARKLYHVYANPDEAAAVAEQAYQFAIKHPWSSKAEQLDGILTDALAQRETPPLAVAA